MTLVLTIQGGLPGAGDAAIAPGEDLFGREVGQATMMVDVVVPLKIVLAPLPGVADVLETSRVIGLVLQGFELALADRVVVADAGPAVATGHAQFGHQVEVGACNHGGTAVLVQGQLAVGDGIAGDGLLHDVLGQRAVLLARDHPGQGVAAVEVQDDVQGQIRTTPGGRQLGDVPGPNLVGGSGHQARDGMVLGGALCAPFPGGLIGTQQAMQRAQRGRCLAVLQQIGMDFRRGLITVGRAVEEVTQSLALGRRERARLRRRQA